MRLLIRKRFLSYDKRGSFHDFKLFGDTDDIFARLEESFLFLCRPGAILAIPSLLLEDIVLDLVVDGFVGVRAGRLGGKARPLLLCQTDTVRVGDLVLHSAVQLVIDYFIKFNESFHAAFSLWLIRLLRFLVSSSSYQVPILLLALLQLLVEGADSFLLHFLGLRRLELVNIADESVLVGFLFGLVRL